MSKEYLDVIDKNNKVIGRALKTTCEKKGLRHRASFLFISNKINKIYLQVRPKWKVHSPNLYSYSVGEHVSSGETYKQALFRGLREELDIKDRPPVYYFTEYHIKRRKMNFLNIEIARCYLMHYDKKIKINKKELAGGKWFSEKEAKILLKKKKVGMTSRKSLYDYLIFRKKLNAINKRFFKSSLSLLVYKKNKVVLRSKKKGIQPLINILNNDPELLRNSIVFDKIIGRAAALLFVHAGVYEAHGVLGSREARTILNKAKINCHFSKTIQKILDKDKTDICPFEKLAKGKTSTAFFQAIKNKF